MSMLSHRPAEGTPASAGDHGRSKPSPDGISGQRVTKGDVPEVSRDTGMGRRLWGCPADLAAVAYSQYN